MTSKKRITNAAVSILMILLVLSLIIMSVSTTAQASSSVILLHNDAANRTISGWTHNGSWEAINPYYGTYPLPGHMVWAGGWESQNNYSVLVSPSIDLTHVTNVTLKFSHYFCFDFNFTGNYGIDGGVVKVSKDGGVNWEQVTPVGNYPGVLTSENVLGNVSAYTGSSGRSWFDQEINLSAYGGFSNVKVAFVIGTSGRPSNAAGWQIDDIQISGIPSINLIKNSGFELGTISWNFYTNGKGSFSVGIPSYTGVKSAKINLTAIGNNMQVYQTGISLEPNTKYRLSFAAYSSIGHDMNIRLFKHGSPYTAYAPDFKVNLGTAWKTFTTEFTSKGFSGNVSDGRLMFYFVDYAYAGDTYWIDNVILEKK